MKVSADTLRKTMIISLCVFLLMGPVDSAVYLFWYLPSIGHPGGFTLVPLADVWGYFKTLPGVLCTIPTVVSAALVFGVGYVPDRFISTET
jgi:hypothetical protein